VSAKIGFSLYTQLSRSFQTASASFATRMSIGSGSQTLSIDVGPRSPRVGQVRLSSAVIGVQLAASRQTWRRSPAMQPPLRRLA
jgi:hypothetical protein